MKTKLFLAALCIFLLPLCFGHSNGNSSQFSAYSSGLNGWGRACECDPNLPGYDPDCVCAATRPTSQLPGKDSALGSEALLALAAIMLWLRLRA
jgi:hypothetical protein